jgi:hypothetical protein
MSEINYFKTYLLCNMVWLMVWKKWVYVIMRYVLIR